MSAVVNVCFHGIGKPGRDLEAGEERYWVSCDAFLSILDGLAEDPRVRISFDDGNASDVELGLPALVERNLRATFFLIAGRLGRPGSVGEPEIRELVDHGMRIGTHGMSHRPWCGLAASDRQYEMVEARQRLESASGMAIDDAALPLGRYDRRLLRDLRRLGYRAVHTSDRRWAHEKSWLQPRFSVRYDDTPEEVRRTVLTAPSLPHRAGRAAVCTAKRWR